MRVLPAGGEDDSLALLRLKRLPVAELERAAREVARGAEVGHGTWPRNPVHTRRRESKLLASRTVLMKHRLCASECMKYYFWHQHCFSRLLPPLILSKWPGLRGLVAL